MIKFMKTTGLAIGLAFASFAATVPAGAQDMELRIGPDGVRPVIRDRDRDRDMDRRGSPVCGAVANAKRAPPPAKPDCAIPKSCASPPAVLWSKGSRAAVRIASHSQTNGAARKSDDINHRMEPAGRRVSRHADFWPSQILTTRRNHLPC